MWENQSIRSVHRFSEVLMNRMEFWTPDMISFMKDAALKTDYFKLIAKKVRQLYPDAKTVCDAGCGTGELSLELSKLFENIIAADLSASAIADLESEIKKREIKNIRAVNCNLLEDKTETIAENSKIDLMIFSFFGRISQAFETAKRFNCPNIVIVKRNYKNHRFSLTEIPIEYGRTYKEELKQYTNDYAEEEFEVEFGQPFKSAEDAVKFFEIYSRDTDRSLLTKENIEKQLNKTEDPVFPLYLSKTRKCLLISADAGGRK